MEKTAEKILKEALALDETDRADVAGALLASLEPVGEADVETAWREEVAARVAAKESGEVETLAWQELRDRLFARLGERRAG